MTHAVRDCRKTRQIGRRDSGVKEMADKKVKITLVKSLIGTKQSHRATVRGLGLRRLNSSSDSLRTRLRCAG
jgi:large subunit ribosomal protein L30